MYVGGNDLAVEGEYTWVDGTVFDRTWGTDQPDNLVSGTEDQDCIYRSQHMDLILAIRTAVACAISCAKYQYNHRMKENVYKHPIR